MGQSGSGESSRIQLCAAAQDEEPILSSLLQLYIHDFSELIEIGIGADGRFAYPQLSKYWTEPGRYPFLLRVDDRLAGFALVVCRPADPNQEPLADVAEFFVLRGFRRQRVGSAAAHALWRRFPGKWRVRVVEKNQAACRFWSQVIAAFVGSPVLPIHTEEHGVPWRVYSFFSPD